MKAGLAGIGVTSGQIVYDSGAYVICKISNGSGTYADNYIRFEQNGNAIARAHSMQMGTGYSSGSDVTGAGLEQPGFYVSSGTYKHRYIKADDGSFGVVQILNSSDVCQGSYGFIKPTNTTQTAADIPLVMGLGSIKGNAVQTGVNGAGFDPGNQSYNLTGYVRYWDSNSNSYVNINSPGNVRLLYSAVKKGNNSYSALGSTAIGFGGQSSSSVNYFGQSVHSVNFGLHSNISGSLPIVPNVPIMSGGVPIGYNSNLVFCPPNLNPGDNIIVSSGTEEYTVISSDGVAIRKV